MRSKLVLSAYEERVVRGGGGLCRQEVKESMWSGAVLYCDVGW